MGGFKSLFIPFTPVKGPWEKTVVERSGGGKERNCFLKTPHLPIGSWEREDRECVLGLWDPVSFFKIFFYFKIYFWLRWVFVAAQTFL